MRQPSKPRIVACHGCGRRFRTRHSQAKWCPSKCRTKAARSSWNRYSAKNRTARRDYSHRYYAENAADIIAKTDAYKGTERGRAVVRKTTANMRQKYPEKYAARQAVRVALRSGKLTKKPCRCGSLNVQAHHSDYSKPLQVEWLCRPCHRKEHEH
jgi:hypothetical protein